MTRFAIGVPARDEEELLPRCLAALDAAARALGNRVPGAEVHVAVGLDACTDGSRAVVGSHPMRHAHLTSVELCAGSAAAARQAACDAAIEAVTGRPAHTGTDAVDAWVATTDADTVVPPNWLVAQHAAHELGYDLFVGTAQPDPDDVSATTLADFLVRHTFAEGHGHVHGANLGLSLLAYEALAGFSPMPVGEDQDLVDRARAAGMDVLATDAARVTTSGRLVGRLDGGFATYLAALHR